MKSIIGGLVAALVIAWAASFVLDTRVQRDAGTAYATDGVRL